MNRTSYREARRYQLSLILIGIAISKQGDRKKLFDSLSLPSVTSARARDCLQSVLDKDVEGVRGFLMSLGVVADESRPALTAIIERLHESVAQEGVEDTLQTILSGSLVEDLDAAEERLTEALRTVRHARETRFTISGS